MNEFDKIIDPLLYDEKVKEMKQYIQHGNVSTYDHCLDVAKKSYVISKKLNINCNTKELVRGAMLHDFYLYDWHDPTQPEGLHGFSHPKVAARKAREHFDINDLEYNIIRNHMWPLTLFHMPKSKEEIIVCVVDKYVSLNETLFKRKK